MPQANDLLSTFQDFNIYKLLEILPIKLRSETMFYIYKDAINIIKILQDREQRFYSNYICLFTPLKVKAGTLLLEIGCQPNEVYFLVNGCILIESEQKQLQPHYFIEGAVFGEKDILQDKMSTETYRAMCDCFLLYLPKQSFMAILSEFPDFRDDILAIARARERHRIEQQLEAKNGIPVEK